MSIDNNRLLQILRIGHEVSIRGAGLPLHEAIRRSGYEALRGGLNTADLVPLLKAHPDFVEQWLMYSEDKRTSGGFWVTGNPIEVGSLTATEPPLHFPSVEEAVAAFVVKEIDYWQTGGACGGVWR